jgi:hypothetical protein
MEIPENRALAQPVENSIVQEHQWDRALRKAGADHHRLHMHSQTSSVIPNMLGVQGIARPH